MDSFVRKFTVIYKSFNRSSLGTETLRVGKGPEWDTANTYLYAKYHRTIKHEVGVKTRPFEMQSGNRVKAFCTKS